VGTRGIVARMKKEVEEVNEIEDWAD